MSVHEIIYLGDSDVFWRAQEVIGGFMSASNLSFDMHIAFQS